MLNFLYHISGQTEVVEDDDKDRFISSGVWFDHPSKVNEAKRLASLKDKPTEDIKNEKKRRKQ